MAAPAEARRPLGLADFQPHVGSSFDVMNGAGRGARLSLVEAADRPPRGQAGATLTGDAFALLFDGGTTSLTSNTHMLAHPALGRVPLFLSPVDQGHNGRRYEAIVNRHALVR